MDIPVSANTVARLLHNMNYSLRANHKKLASDSSPFRDQQFQYIYSLRHRFQRRGLPMISVDTKKRELLGNCKNAGAKWILDSVYPVTVKDPVIGQVDAYAQDALMGKIIADYFISDSGGKGALWRSFMEDLCRCASIWSLLPRLGGEGAEGG